MYALILAFFLAVSPARAQEDDATAALAGGRFAEIADQIGLDATQRKQVSDTVYAANTAKIDIQARAEKARLELKHLLAAETLDEKAVLKAADALSAAETELRRNRVQLLLSLRKALRPEQWQRLLTIRDERREDRRDERRDERREERRMERAPGDGGMGAPAK